MAATATAEPAQMDGDISPRQKSPQIEQAIQSLVSIDNGALGSLDLRADPDAQTTVTDFLDFTEYLPADMMRSLTLIGKLDQTYTTASENIHELTTKWGQLPNLPAEQRSPPVRLRADISRNLTHAVNARTYSHAEAIRMAENVNRHYIRASTILTKLQTMLENYPPPEEQKSPVVTAKSPQLSRVPKFTMRIDGHRVRRANVPRITVPGEVLAPYDLNYELYSGDEDSSSESESDDDLDEDDGSLSTTRATPGPPRIKLLKKGGRPPKAGRTPKSRSSGGLSHYGAGISTSTALAQLQPPPENVVIGSADAPWGQLTQWELARLRKRMKKNAAWAPSDTMIARELKSLGRGVEAFNAAKQKAEEEGKPFDGTLPAPVVDPVTGVEALPPGALTKEALAAEEKNLSNRGMKLNEAKKLKREQLAKQAAEEAEESAMKMIQAARAILDAQGQAKKELTASEGIFDRKLNLRRSNAPEPPSQSQWEGVVDDDDDKDDEEEGDKEEEGNDYESYDGERHPGSWAPPPYQQASRPDLPGKQQDGDLEVQPGGDNGNSAHAASPEEKLLDDPGKLGPVQQPSIDDARHSPHTTGMKQEEVTNSQIESGSGASKVERTLDTPTAAASKPLLVNDQVPQTLGEFTSELHHLEFGRDLKWQSGDDDSNSANPSTQGIRQIPEVKPPSPTAALQDPGDFWKRIPEEVWLQHREEIMTLYQTMTLEQVRLHMRDQYNFTPTYDSFLYPYPPNFAFLPSLRTRPLSPVYMPDGLSSSD